MNTAEWKDLHEFPFARATEHDSPQLLFRLACEYLLPSRVLRSGVIFWVPAFRAAVIAGRRRESRVTGNLEEAQRDPPAHNERILVPAPRWTTCSADRRYACTVRPWTPSRPR